MNRQDTLEDKTRTDKKEGLDFMLLSLLAGAVFPSILPAAVLFGAYYLTTEGKDMQQEKLSPVVQDKRLERKVKYLTEHYRTDLRKTLHDYGATDDEIEELTKDKIK